MDDDLSTRFKLNADQVMLVEMVTSFAAKEIAPYAIEWDREKHFPLDLFEKAADLGLGGVCVAENVGGSALGRLESIAIFEALATGCPSIGSYISIHNMVAWMIDAYGTEDQRQRYLPKMCAMESLGSYCLTEASSGSDAAALRTKAERDGDEFVLNGVKQFVSGAGASEVYIVMARTGGPGPRGISAFLIERDTPGVSFGANEKKMGWNAQPTREVILEDVRVPATALLGEEGAGFRIAMSGLNGGRLNIGAASVGGAQAALDQAIAHMKEREAFGEPLAAFQALRFRVADMATELEAARLLLQRAAAAYDAGDDDATRWCAMAKRLATDTGFAVANGALQLLGGNGYMVEYGIEKIVRDLRVHQILEGTNEIMRVIVSRTIFEGR